METHARRLLIATLLMGLSINYSCAPSSDKTTIYLGMWPEAQQVQDIAMYNQWKMDFENANP